MKWLQLLPILLAGIVVLAAAGFVAVSVLGAGKPPDGPVDVVWDREVCAHCQMHVGEPAFAAQLQTKDGAVLSFDDPGCAFLLLEQRDVNVHALYFRHHREDRWLPAERTAFAPVAVSPMGFGLAAVDAGTQGAIPVDEARRRTTRNR